MDPDPPARDTVPSRSLAHRDAWVEVDLAAVVANTRAMQALCGPACRLAPVVKANAYGHGAVPVARALADAGFDAFCVATIDEGAKLRSAGIGGRLLLLYEPPLAALADAVELGLEVTVGSAEALAVVSGLPLRERKRLALQLKIDTGMTRQGVRADRLDEAEAVLRRIRGSVVGIWTHLANGADPSADLQIERFDSAVARLAGFGIQAERHVAASAAILTGRATAYELARPGIALFGCVPPEYAEAGRQLPVALRPAMTVRARAIRVEEAPSGTRVGYGGTFEVDRRCLIALLPLGYADGLRRNLGNGNSGALLHGRTFPIVGRVSMDSCTVDVTAADRRPTRDDVWTIVGRDGEGSITIEELARRAGTIAQEILVGFDQRLPKVYVRAS